MKLAAIFVLAALAASGAETIVTFQPQGNITSRVALWTAASCPAKAVPIGVIYSLATHHGIPWMLPEVAQRLFEQKSAWSRAVKVAGWLSAGGSVLTGFDVVKARPQVVTGLAVGGAVILVLLPLAAKEIPRVDPSVGRPLMLSTDGCGVASFYSAPTNVLGFNEVLP